MNLSKATLTMIWLLLVSSLLFCKPSYGALRSGRQFLQDLQAARRDNEQLQRNVALLQRAMIQMFPGGNATSTTAEVPDYACPKLDDTKQNVDLQSLLSTRNGGALAKALRRMSSTLTLPALQAKLQRSSTERAKFNQAVDSFNVKAVIDVVTETASHFAALAAQAKGDATKAGLRLSNQNSTTKINTTTTLATDALELMESLSSTSANALHAIATALSVFATPNDKKAKVGLVTLSLMSVLRFLDQVSLGIASLVVDYLKVLSSTSESRNKLQVQAVRKALSKRGVFAPVVDFLSKRNEMLDLKDALSAIVATDLATLDHRLEQFTTKANAAALGRNSRITNETLAETTGLMIAIMGTAYNGFIHIVVDVLLNDLPNVFRAGYGMMLSSSVRINQKMASTFNSIFDLVITVTPTDQKDTAGSGDNAVVSADLVFFIGIVLCRVLNQRCEGGWQILRIFFYIIALLPIWLPLAIIITLIFGPNDDEEEDDGCCFGPGLPFPFTPIDVLQCQNDALSSVLPSI